MIELKHKTNRTKFRHLIFTSEDVWRKGYLRGCMERGLHPLSVKECYHGKAYVVHIDKNDDFDFSFLGEDYMLIETEKNLEEAHINEYIQKRGGI